MAQAARAGEADAKKSKKPSRSGRAHKEVAPPVAMGDEEDISAAKLNALTVKDLRERCKGVGVPSSGKKAELIERLLNTAVST